MITNSTLSNSIGNTRARLAIEEMRRAREKEIAGLLGGAIERGTGAIVQGIGAHEAGNLARDERAEDTRRWEATQSVARDKAAADATERARKAELDALARAEPAIPTATPDTTVPSMRDAAKAALPEKRASQWASGGDLGGSFGGDELGPSKERREEIERLQAVAESQDPDVDVAGLIPGREMTPEERGAEMVKRSTDRTHVSDAEVAGIGAERALSAREQRAKEAAALQKAISEKPTVAAKNEAQTGLIGAKTATERERPENVRADTALKRARAESLLRDKRARTLGVGEKEFGLNPNVKVPEALRKKVEDAGVGLTEMDYIASEYDRLAQKYGGDLTGPFNAFTHRIKGSAGYDDPDISAFFATVNTFKTIRGHELFGSALSKHELRSLLDTIPYPGDNDPSFIAKVKAQRANARRQVMSRIMSPINAPYFVNPERFGEEVTQIPSSGQVQTERLSPKEARQRAIEAFMASLRAAGVPKEDAVRMAREADAAGGFSGAQ